MEEKEPPEAKSEQVAHEQSSSESDPVKDRIVAKLVEKQGSHPLCPVCHFNQFGVGQFVALSVLSNPNEGRLGGVTYPLVVLFCGRCGAAQFINLLLLGFTHEELASLTMEVIPPPPTAEKSSG